MISDPAAAAVPREDCDVRRRKAIQAWQWGRDMGYPHVRPGLEDRREWHTEPG